MGLRKGLMKGIQGVSLSGASQRLYRDISQGDDMWVRVWVLRLSVWGLEAVNLLDDILHNPQIPGPQELWQQFYYSFLHYYYYHQDFTIITIITYHDYDDCFYSDY